jgi:hypothetical protein
MKFFFKSKDGGPDSNVTGYWLFESKRFGSIVLLRFDRGSREAFHNHAFNAVSWVLKGYLVEEVKENSILGINLYNLLPSFKPLYTARDRMHKVYGIARRTWVLSFRGPWNKTWKEYLPKEGREITLTNGRKEVVECEQH